MKQIEQREIAGLVTALAAKVDAEGARDVIGAALVAGANVTITVNDAGDTITIASTGGATDPEVVRDTIASTLIAGSNVTITVDDAGDTITIASTGGGGSSGGVFKGTWTATPDEIVWQQDFTSDLTPFTGAGARTAMASAVGTAKPSYSYADQAAQAGPGTSAAVNYNLQSLALASVPALSGRIPTRMKVWMGYALNMNFSGASTTQNFSVLKNGTSQLARSITLSSGSAQGAWEEVTVSGLSPADTLVFNTSANHGYGTGTIAISGVRIYAVLAGWTGYSTGQVVVYSGRLFQSNVDANTDQPTVGAGATSWTEIPIYATPKVPNAQTGTSYTLVLDDVSRAVTLANAGAIALTVPTNAVVPFPLGTRITIVQGAAGGVTFTPATGVTINNNAALAGQWQRAELLKTGTDTWLKM